MLNIAVIDNGIGGLEAFPADDQTTVHALKTGSRFSPDLSQFDLLVVPNGADHVAMLQIRGEVQSFLNSGKSLFCFCGWFTDWIPGYRWIHDASKPTREVRHIPASDPHGLLDGVDLSRLDTNRHGIHGWWACGYIQTSHSQSVLVRDTWNRPLIIADESSTPGFLFLTASGPVGKYSWLDNDSPVNRLYSNALNHVRARQGAIA